LGTVTCTITDNGGTGQSITLQFIEGSGQNDTYGYSPPPTTVKKTRKRAIVQHEVFDLERDVGQDKGRFSDEYDLTGLSRQDVRDSLDAFSALPQFPTGPGRISFTLTDSHGNQIESHSGLALRDYSTTYPASPGARLWFLYTLKFIDFSGQTP
jgi:hypothetical protein